LTSVLADRFLAGYCVAQAWPDAKRFSQGGGQPAVMRWPGNIRGSGDRVPGCPGRAGPRHRAGDVHFMHQQSGPGLVMPSRLRPLRDVERDHIQRVLDATGWNKKRATRVPQIGRETLYRKIAGSPSPPGGAGHPRGRQIPSGAALQKPMQDPP
jgi:hypothetical protein